MSALDVRAGAGALALRRSRWLLPDGVEELLPPQAEQLETLRRKLLDLCASWGYELVAPPLIEYLDSLLTGFGSDLDLQTLKVIDQLTGRSMGVRADVTSQAARIDAHVLKRDGEVRLCYAETVLHALPSGALESRCPLLVGAELFGSTSVAADAEITCLMIDTLRAATSDEFTVELGHVQIVSALCEAAAFARDTYDALFGALQRKSVSDIRHLLRTEAIPTPLKDMFLRLPELMGDDGVIAEARVALADAPPRVTAAIDEIARACGLVRRLRPDVGLRVDVAESRGYGYHTGLVFAAYLPGYGGAVARGGRYDGIGAAFGRSRPATGFDADLKLLARLTSSEGARVIVAPGLEENVQDPVGLQRAVDSLRAQGHRVVWSLSENAGADARLVWRGNAWVVSHG